MSYIRQALIQNKLNEQPENYCVAAWEDGNLSPTSIETYGSKSFAGDWDFYLFDTSINNTGETAAPVGKLKRNNLFRFADNTFAPVVGITEEMRAECDVELYLDVDHTQKYCDAGAFNATDFYNTHGMAKLYNSSAAEVRVLRPWETVETKYTIGLGRKDTVYLLDNVVGDSGKRWKGIFSCGCNWDGIDVSQYPLPPTAISPCPITTIDGKARNFFYLYEGESNCRSYKGQVDCTIFQNGRTYPRVNDVNQANIFTYTRKNNSDTNSPLPYAEGGYHALNTYITCQEVICDTKDLRKIYSNGISGVDACNNEDQWKSTGGVKWKISTDTDWRYNVWGAQPTGICYNTTGTNTSWNVWVNQEYPKEQCMESQMVASYIVEQDIEPGVEFEFYGGTYWYIDVTGATKLKDGVMNVKILKKMTGKTSAYDNTDEHNPIEVDLEVVLRFSLIAGANLSGDIFAYWGGGYEAVGTVGEDTAAGTVGHRVDLYIEPDQSKWHKESVVTKNDLGVFDFESTYRKVATVENLGDGYSAARQSYTPWRTEKGGSINTGECYYQWDNKHWSTVLNQRVRIGARSRGLAILSTCAPRYLASTYAASYSYHSHAGSAQIRMDVSSLQAE